MSTRWTSYHVAGSKPVSKWKQFDDLPKELVDEIVALVMQPQFEDRNRVDDTVQAPIIDQSCLLVNKKLKQACFEVFAKRFIFARIQFKVCRHIHNHLVIAYDLKAKIEKSFARPQVPTVARIKDHGYIDPSTLDIEAECSLGCSRVQDDKAKAEYLLEPFSTLLMLQIFGYRATIFPTLKIRCSAASNDMWEIIEGVLNDACAIWHDMRSVTVTSVRRMGIEEPAIARIWTERLTNAARQYSSNFKHVERVLDHQMKMFSALMKDGYPVHKMANPVANAMWLINNQTATVLKPWESVQDTAPEELGRLFISRLQFNVENKSRMLSFLQKVLHLVTLLFTSVSENLLRRPNVANETYHWMVEDQGEEVLLHSAAAWSNAPERSRISSMYFVDCDKAKEIQLKVFRERAILKLAFARAAAAPQRSRSRSLPSGYSPQEWIQMSVHDFQAILAVIERRSELMPDFEIWRRNWTDLKEEIQAKLNRVVCADPMILCKSISKLNLV